jgi:hypothetical protein
LITPAYKLERKAIMAANSKTFAYGKLEASTDSWLLAREQVTLLDISIPFDTSLERKMLSVIGRMQLKGSGSNGTYLSRTHGFARLTDFAQTKHRHTGVGRCPERRTDLGSGFRRNDERLPYRKLLNTQP